MNEVEFWARNGILDSLAEAIDLSKLVKWNEHRIFGFRIGLYYGTPVKSNGMVREQIYQTFKNGSDLRAFLEGVESGIRVREILDETHTGGGGP